MSFIDAYFDMSLKKDDHINMIVDVDIFEDSWELKSEID